MADEKQIKAEEMYGVACTALDEMGWTYDRDDEKLVISTGAKGDDFPISLIIRILADAETISVISPLNFNISEKTRIEAAIAVSVANDGMIRGGFDYDFTDGEIRFRVTAPYNNSEISTDVIKLLLLIAANTMDNYNDKFFMLSKGALSIQDFIKQEKGED